jgi:hypothetical protein
MAKYYEEVTLNPGESQKVCFEVIPTEAGVYIVSVDGLSGSFTAKEQEQWPVLDFGNIIIRSIDDTPFSLAEIGSNGIGHAQLSSPLVVDGLRGHRIGFSYVGPAISHEMYDNLVFFLQYEILNPSSPPCAPGFEPGYRQWYQAPYNPATGLWSVPFEGNPNVKGVWAGGYWCPGDYNIYVRCGMGLGTWTYELLWEFRVEYVSCTSEGNVGV